MPRQNTLWPDCYPRGEAQALSYQELTVADPHTEPGFSHYPKPRASSTDPYAYLKGTGKDCTRAYSNDERYDGRKSNPHLPAIREEVAEALNGNRDAICRNLRHLFGSAADITKRFTVMAEKLAETEVVVSRPGLAAWL